MSETPGEQGPSGPAERQERRTPSETPGEQGPSGPAERQERRTPSERRRAGPPERAERPVPDGDGGGPAGAEEGERGLQAERTELAWVRTALACGVLTTVTGRLGEHGIPHAASYALGAAVGTAGIAASVIRIGALRGRPPGPGVAPPPPPTLAVALLVAAVVVANLTVAVTILTT